MSTKHVWTRRLEILLWTYMDTRCAKRAGVFA